MDWMQRLKDQFGDKIKEDKKFSEVTTLEIGGPIKAFIEADSQDELVEILKYVEENQIPYLIIGGGSNLLVSDEGVDFLVIKNNVTGITICHSERSEESPTNVGITATETSSEIPRPPSVARDDKVKLTVQAGTVLQDLVNYTIENGLAGLNKMTGVPGTVGGAVYGNAAAYGQTISDHIIKVTYFDKARIKTFSKTECGFDYRTSNFKKTKFPILEITFEFPKGDEATLKKEASETLDKRLVKYPPGRKTPGSFFKNVFMKDIPEESKHLIPLERDYYGKVPAWFFLNEVGARGDNLRQIKITDNHGNTFMNLGEGSAEDFYKLAKKYHQKVKEKFNIELEPEVQLINLPSLN